ncbi:unnamed protein product [Diplocarpon coronariae]
MPLRRSERLTAPPPGLTATSSSSTGLTANPSPRDIPPPEPTQEETSPSTDFTPGPGPRVDSRNTPLPSIEVKEEDTLSPTTSTLTMSAPLFSAAQQAEIANLVGAAVAAALQNNAAAPSSPSASPRNTRSLTADLLPPPDYYLPIIRPSVPAVDPHRIKYPQTHFSNHQGEITYNAWKMAMKVFIQEYSGNFTSGEDQITAYFKCTTGEAQNLILQHMDPVFASEFTCAADVLRVLDQRFFDHNYVQSAKLKYSRLTMGSLSYNEFRSKFVTLAMAGKIDQSRWFDDVCEKVSPALKNDLRVEKYKMNNDYTTLDEFLAIADREARNIKQEEAYNARRVAPAVAFSSKDRVPGILKRESWRPTATATSPAPRTRSPSPAAHRERSASPKPSSGLCYNCGAPGHYATDCPKPKKQGDRGKDSYHGIGHNLWKDLDFDSRLLIGGRQFLVPVELARNGSFIKTVAHIDGGANIFGIIKTSLAYQLSQRLGVKFIKLPKPITPTGYNGLEGETIRFAVLLTLTIDRRRINFPFLITSLGATDVLIGRKFLEHYDLKQSYGKGKNRISWPKDMPIVPYFDRRVLIDLSRPTKPLMAQQDVDRVPDPPLPLPVKRNAPLKTACQISLISASAIGALHHRFMTRARRAVQTQEPAPEEFTFVSSVHDLDREINRRESAGQAEISSLGLSSALQAKYESNDELIDQKLPPQYAEFKNVFSRQASDQLPKPRPGVDHKIELTGENNLTIEPLRRLTDEQLSEVKSYILENLHKGFIEASSSPQAAPILFVRKADGSLRLCVDYRKLNALTKKDPYPIPLIDEMMARISKARVFTKIDIQQAFHRIRMSADAEDLTTFRTRYGTYKYKVLPFGLTNGPATFQRFINDILLEHLDDFCSAYLDDILIYSENSLDHEIHVKKILGILQRHGLQADIKKRNVPFDFNDTCKEAWEALRSSLQTTPILCHYHPQKQTRLETDASDGVVAGVLSQLQEDENYHPIGYFSKTMNDAELNYPIHDKELLAIFRSGDSTPGPGPRATSAQINSTPGPGPRVTIVPIAPIEAPADPTSRVEYDVASYHIIDEVIQANKTSPELQKFRDEAQSHSLDYELSQGKLFFQGRLVVPSQPPELRTALIRHVHEQPCVAHAGIGKTRLLNCRCSRMKARRDKTPGFLQPLPIPERAYQHLTMDFTELPLDELGYDFALVIIDRLSKKAVSIPCYKTVDAKGLAELFLIHWIRHFGMPDSILSDRGAQFVSTFWNELLLNGYEARSSWSLINPEPPRTATERVNRETALRIATRAQKVVQFAQSSLQAQQAKMKRLADLHRRPVDWTVGDDVLISTKNWKLDRPSRKLSDKWYGPVKVLEKLGESWKLQLPDSLRSIYPVFHSHSLRKYLPNPLPGQVREPPAPIKILPEQEEWEIEEIIGSRIRARKLEYQIKWKGADEDLEWYPCSDAMTAPHAIRSFHLKNPQAKGPPRALSSWLRSYNDGVDDYRDLEDNTPMDTTARAQFFKRGVVLRPHHVLVG